MTINSARAREMAYNREKVNVVPSQNAVDSKRSREKTRTIKTVDGYHVVALWVVEEADIEFLVDLDVHRV